MSFGEKCLSQKYCEKKWGKMTFGEKCHREKCRGEKCHLGKNVLHPSSSLDFSQFLREQFLKITFSLLSQNTNFLNKEIACLVKLIKELKLYAIVTVLDVGVKIISYLEQLLIFSIKVNRIAIFTSSPGC